MTRTEALAVILPTLDLQTARLYEEMPDKYLFLEMLCDDRLENTLGRSLPSLWVNESFTYAVLDAVEDRLEEILAGYHATQY